MANYLAFWLVGGLISRLIKPRLLARLMRRAAVEMAMLRAVAT